MKPRTHFAKLDLEQLFLRYRERGDPQALAQVFDALAPDLLALAIHLVGDAASAEDLVQETFVTAIERAATFDEQRTLRPWLVGILNNLALAQHRAARRVPDPLQLVPRAEPERPDDLAESAEFSGALARALDELPEPYRQPLVLGLRHGMQPADIAHVLSRSPGTVRSQLARGRSLLERALPTAFLASLALLLTPTRGLAAVREVVLTKAGAASTAVAVGSAVTLGSLLIMKKALVAALVLVLCGVLWKAATWRGVDTQGVTRESLQPAQEELAEAATTPAEALPEEPGTARIVASTSSSEEAAQANLSHTLQVIDAATSEPLAEVQLEVFAPRETTLLELRERWRAWSTESVAVRNGTWLGHILGRERPTHAQLLSLEPLRAFDTPIDPGLLLAETSSDADGRATLTLPQGGAVLSAALEGYGTRHFALRPSALPDEALPETIELSALTLVRGHLLDENGRAMTDPLRLRCERFSDGGSSPEGMEVELSPNGSFSFEVGYQYLELRCLTPGWALGDYWTDEVSGEMHIASRTLTASEFPLDIELVAVRLPMTRLFVHDAESGEPIEDPWILAFNNLGSAQSCRSFHAPDGMLALAGDANLLASSMNAEFVKRISTERLELSIWAEGYSAAELEVRGVLDDVVIDVPLERGALPEHKVRVLMRGEPLSHQIVSLLARAPVRGPNQQVLQIYNPDLPLDLTTTNADGLCSFHAQPGRYHVTATVDGEFCYTELVLPGDELNEVDLGMSASLAVRVFDSAGEPVERHKVMTLSNRVRTIVPELTNAEGLARFTQLVPGKWTVHVPREVGELHNSLRGALEEELDLKSGEHRELEFHLPAKGSAIHARLVVHGAPVDLDLRTWRARLEAGFRPEWTTVLPSGEIPLDVHMGEVNLEIEAPSGARWSFRIEDAPTSPPLFVVELEGLAYRGRLTARGSDEPQADVRITAKPMSGVGTTCSAVTNQRGEFTLCGLGAQRHRLAFREASQASNSWQPNAPYARTSFETNSLPSETGIELELAIPMKTEGSFDGFETLTVSGVVRSRATKQTIEQAWVHLQGVEFATDGEWFLYDEHAGLLSDEEGAFELRVPRADLLFARVIDQADKARRSEQRSAPPSGESGSLDLWLD